MSMQIITLQQGSEEAAAKVPFETEPSPATQGLAVSNGETPASQVPIETEDGETLTLGQINALLAPVSINAAGLAELGFQPVAIVKAAKLYNESDFPAICRAIAQHIQDVATVNA